jgi:AAA family ATP:ADP antiporter
MFFIHGITDPMTTQKPDLLHEFTGLRALLWPIHTFELKKFIPTALIMWCILFNYTVMRDVKDSLVVNAAGGNVISFLKLYCVTPAAILFVIAYAKLSNIFSSEKLFYIIITPFVLFYGLFGFVLYPNLELLHPSAQSLEHLHAAYPRLSGFIDIYGHWTYALFYVLAEIWGSAMLALMFWQFANRITRVHESKRFYGLFGVIANTSLIVSGQALVFFSTGMTQNLTGVDPWTHSLKWLCGMIVVMGVLPMLIYRWMHTSVLSDPKYYDATEEKAQKKKKQKLGLVESAKLIFASKELGYIALLIIGYGITINLVEVQFKSQLGLYFKGDCNGYTAFMGRYSQFTGLLTIAFGWLIGANVLSRMSWLFSAVVTPLFTLCAGGVFFFFIVGREMAMKLLVGMDPVMVAVFLGATIVIMSKSVKYSLFDPTKEMAYLPLDPELKGKGKAAVDVIGGRAGKAGGAFIQSTMAIVLASKDVLLFAPYTAVIFIVVCGAWILAVKGLDGSIKGAIKRKEAEEIKREVEGSDK